jgi:hypothetical protein
MYLHGVCTVQGLMWFHRRVGWTMRQALKVLVSGRCLVGLALLSAASGAAQSLSADEIVTRMMGRNSERQAMLLHYASDRAYHLEYNGTGGDHHAEMVVHAEYTAPGRKKLTIVSASGSKVLCAEVLQKLVEGEQETADKQDWARAMFSPDTYNLRLLGQEELEGVPTWVLRVDPKAATKVGYRGKLWVSMDDYAMVRLQAEPAKNPSWMLTHASFDAWYTRHGEVWLPEKNISTTHVRIGGDAKVTIDYGRYPVLTTEPLSAALAPGDASPQAEPPAKRRGNGFH